MTNYNKYLEVIDFFDIKDDGRIFRKERVVENNGGLQTYPHKEVKQHKVRGYLGVNIMIDGKHYHLFSHVLVKLFFDGLPDDLDYVIDHKDGNKQNNRRDNLEYVSQSENCLRAFKLGLNYTSDKQRENRRNRMIENNPMKNKDVAKKVSLKKLGKNLSEEHKMKISLSQKGKKTKDSTIRKLGNPVLALDGCGDIMFSFNSVREAHRNGFDRYSVKKALENKIQYKGFFWKYDN